MRMLRVLVGVSFLFFCTALMHASRIGMQDPSICSNGTPGAVEVDGNSFTFAATANGTSTDPTSPTPQLLCFLNGSEATWNNILVTVDPSSPTIAAASVFCDSPTNQFGTAFTCQVSHDANGDLTSIFFFAAPGQTGIPSLANLFIDLNACSQADPCPGASPEQEAGVWPDGFKFDAAINVPEPTSFALLGTGLLITFRRRLLKSKD